MRRPTPDKKPKREEPYDFSQARYCSIDYLPYLYSHVASLVPVSRPGLGTLAVDEHMRVYYDPAVFDKWTLEETTAVILHEDLHALLCHAHRLTELRGSPKSTLRQMSRQQYVQFCNVCASVFTELDLEFNARTFQEACKVVGNENPPYVGDPLPVESWEKAIKIAEGRGQAVLVQIGRNVAKVFPQWLRELRRPK